MSTKDKTRYIPGTRFSQERWCEIFELKTVLFPFSSGVLEIDATRIDGLIERVEYTLMSSDASLPDHEYIMFRSTNVAKKMASNRSSGEPRARLIQNGPMASSSQRIR